MKSKLTFSVMAFGLAVVCSLQTVIAQNTWSLAGNNNATANSKMGTTNAIPIKLTTNNQTRVYINATNGNVGIGTGDNSTLNYKLQVTGDAYGISGFASMYGLFGSGDYGVYGAGNTYGLYGTGSFGVYGSGNAYGVYGIAGANGYGVAGYSSDGVGAWGLSTSGYGVQGSSDYLGVYGEGNTFGLYGTSEQYGVFGYSPGNFGVYGNSNGGNGIRGASVNSDGGYFTSSKAYGIRAGTTTGFYAGVFDGNVYAFGNYYSSSDRNLKKNIQDFSDAMSIINKLQPKNYEFRTDEKFGFLNLPKGTHYGLIAQELEEVLPNLVKESPMKISSEADDPIKPGLHDGKTPTAATEQKVTKVEAEEKEIMNIKGVNYEELIPIIIKGMQEQDAKIESLTQLVNRLQNSSVTQNAQNINSTSPGNASLSQNVPNPLTNRTTIRYSIPAGSAKALLNFTDNNGNIVKQILLNGSGNGLVNIETSGLSAGTYSYTLVVDNKKIETKKMIIAR